MATSGSFETNAVSGTGSSPNRMRFEWGLASQSEDGNYSIINWNIRGTGGLNSNWWTQNFQARTWIDGSNVQTTGSFQMYHNVIFGSGSFQLNHDGNGNRSFGANADGRILNNTVNSSGSGSWDLPSLYQEIAINSISVQNITDTSFQVRVTTNRTANLLQLNINGAGFVTYYSGNYSDVTVQVGDSSSNQLLSNQTYSFVVRVRRASNSNLTDSGTQQATTLPQGNFFAVGDF